jgi:hypothetical protein
MKMNWKKLFYNKYRYAVVTILAIISTFGFALTRSDFTFFFDVPDLYPWFVGVVLIVSLYFIGGTSSPLKFEFKFRRW